MHTATSIKKKVRDDTEHENKIDTHVKSGKTITF